MKDSQLIQTLKALDKRELKDFEKLISSSFFNRGRNYVPFFKELKKFYPDFSSSKVTKEYFYCRLYPGKQFNKQVIKNLINGLTRLTEEYFFQINKKNNLIDYYIAISDELSERMVFKAAKRNINTALSLQKQSGLSEKYFNNMYQILNIEKIISRYQNNISVQGKKFHEGSLFYFSSFIIGLMEIMAEMQAYISNENFDFRTDVLYEFIESEILSDLSNYLKENLPEYSEIITIYHNIIKLNSRKIDEDIFFETCRLLKRNLGNLDRAAKNHIYGYLQNISISLGAINRDKYRPETLRLLKEMLENNAFSASEELHMDAAKFRNVLIAAIDLKEFKWCENFIRDYIPHLAPEYRENMYSYSQARICFSKKQFEESLEYLSRVKYDMFALKYDIKALSLSLYYELAYFEEAFSLIDSFKHFISDNKSLSPRRKEVQNNFVNFASELLKVKSGRKSINLNKLKDAIQNTNSVLSKHWLLEKTDELLESKKEDK